MGTELYWVDGPWPGKLALSARPRGGDLLEDEIANWHRAGVDTVLSLLTPEEEQNLDLSHERRAVTERSMNFMSLPIQDREVPGSETEDRESAGAGWSQPACSSRRAWIHSRRWKV
jgi:hypothetical protein